MTSHQNLHSKSNLSPRYVCGQQISTNQRACHKWNRKEQVTTCCTCLMHDLCFCCSKIHIPVVLNILLLWWWSLCWLRRNRWCSHLHWRLLLLHSLSCCLLLLGVPKHGIKGYHSRSSSCRRLTSSSSSRRHCSSIGIGARRHWRRKRRRSGSTRSGWLLLSSSSGTLHKSLQGDQIWVLFSKGHHLQ